MFGSGLQHRWRPLWAASGPDARSRSPSSRPPVDAGNAGQGHRRRRGHAWAARQRRSRTARCQRIPRLPVVMLFIEVKPTYRRLGAGRDCAEGGADGTQIVLFGVPGDPTSGLPGPACTGPQTARVARAGRPGPARSACERLLVWHEPSGRYPGPATGELLLGLSLCPANDIIGFLSLRLGTPPTVA